MKDSAENINSVKEDELVELNEEEVEKIIAVGNSVESGKWFLDKDLAYLKNKKFF